MSTTPSGQRLAYSVAAAAKEIGIGRSKAYALIKRGDLASITIDTRRLVTHQQLVDYLESRIEAAS